MFRRDKDTRLDNEGLRRMREAIRHRLEQEEGDDTEGGTASEDQYRATQGDDDFDEVAPFNPDTLSSPSYGGGSNEESNYSYLTAGRNDRTLPSFELPATPARVETPAWTPTPTPAPAVPEPVVPSGPAISTVAVDTSWRGTLRSGASIQIDGNFEGQIDTEQELVISADGKVEATVRAESITVAGQLNGQINCRGRLEILPSGRVSGQIDAGKFVVHEGAYLGGQVRMTSATNAEDGARPMLQRVR
ncbi:MAG: polymer-forming cytoskeletal protein [Chloroflexia bacterium]